jgi:N-acetylglutamate synthase-like GNAT family acetyltransferase
MFANSVAAIIDRVKQAIFRRKLLSVFRAVINKHHKKFNGWFYFGRNHIYIRVWFWDKVYRIDLANINWHPNYMGKGHLTALLEYLERTGYEIRVESVLSTRFQNMLRNRGYEPDPNTSHILEMAPTLIFNKTVKHHEAA